MSARIPVAEDVDPKPLLNEADGHLDKPHKYPEPPLYVKLGWGMGTCAELFMGHIIGGSSLTYYHQILGLSGTLHGVGVAIALLIDSAVEPIIGEFSDKISPDSRLGKRHPLMYAAILPCAIGLLSYYNCPFDDQWLMFLWMLLFQIFIRASISLFSGPHAALGSDMSPSYYGAHKTMRFSSLSHCINPGLSALNLFLIMQNKGGHKNGNLNKDNYPTMAIFYTSFSVFAMLVASGTTQMFVKQIPKVHGKARDGFRGMMRNIFAVFKIVATSTPPLRILFLAVFIHSLAFGFMETNITLVNLYYWKKQPKIQALFPLAWPFTTALTFFLSPMIVKRFDKKAVVVASQAVHLVFYLLPYGLRGLGLISTTEEIGTIVVLWIVFAMNGIVTGCMGPIVMSMWADCIVELQTKTGEKGNALVMSMRSLSGKLGNGLSHTLAGAVLDLMAFPTQKDEIRSGQVLRLVLVNIGITTVVSLIVIFTYSRYPVDVKHNTETIKTLLKQNSCENIDEAILESAREANIVVDELSIIDEKQVNDERL